MSRSSARRHLSLEDVHLCKQAATVLQLFSKLGYQVEGEATALPKDEVGFTPADTAAIRHLYLLADQDGDAGLPLQVILFELEEVALARLRSLAGNLLNRGGNYLLVATSDYRRLTLVNPRREAGRVKIRKLVVDTSHPTRHDLDVLEGLAADDHDPEALYAAHCEAFDVEKVTSRFYREYAEIFHHIEQAIQASNPARPEFYKPENLHAFAQRLLGRLMFLYFIQKKGWLAGDPRFLTNQYRIVTRGEGNYYALVLEPLFFDTLNRRRPNDESRWGSIPYLNGGLFEKDYDFLVVLPNELFDPGGDNGVLGFFNDYNFTVAEDTPVEQEVAVDPEMLGKVFENMMEERERGKSGTFYTPRPIVHYMCREALLGYLQDRTGLDRTLLASQFDEDTEEPLAVAPARTVERVLDEVRVLDPAVGTGAFLVGILHELVTLKRACYRAQGAEVHRGGSLVAGWKRRFIAESLHGVDIKAEAIEIAKLRLWLSLVVDLERDQVEALPNLDYKLMVGNSLLETLDGKPILQLEAKGQMTLGLSPTEQALAELHRLKDTFFSAEPEDRPNLRAEIQAQETRIVLGHLDERMEALSHQRDELARKGALVNWKGMAREQRRLEGIARELGTLTETAKRIEKGEAPPFFLYRLHFFDVFRDRGGFDVVIANPPYVRQQLISEQKEEFKATYPSVYHGVADLYVYFYARGLDLLRSGGILAYISSNKFMRAGYGEKLRRLLSEDTALESIIDFGDLPVFEATAYPCIVITRKAKPTAGHGPLVLAVNQVQILDRLEEEVPRRAQLLAQHELHSEGWALEGTEVLHLVNKLRAVGRPLGEVVEERFYRGVTTGLNEAFVIGEATREQLVAEDPCSAEIIKPWLRGRDVKRWRVNWPGLYLIWAYQGIDISKYPAVLSHLQNFQGSLSQRWEPRKGQCKWYELRPCDYYDEFRRPRIIWAKYGLTPSFAYDPETRLCSNTAFILPTDDLFLLAVLNSSITNWLAVRMFNLVRGGYIEWIPANVGQLPIPDAGPAERRAIAGLVARLLELRGEGLEAAELELEVNERVYRLFGLDNAEMVLVKASLTQV